MNPKLRAILAGQQGLHAVIVKPHELYGEVNYPKVQGLGFKYGLSVYRAGGFIFGRNVLIPFWFLIALFSVVPAFTVATRNRRLRMARIQAGRCGACDYDLTGNTSGVCPECGARILS